jgi:hypothetical protein
MKEAQVPESYTLPKISIKDFQEYFNKVKIVMFSFSIDCIDVRIRGRDGVVENGCIDWSGRSREKVVRSTLRVL